ncbi:hypothetical protein BHYA_0054g00260 [Botrytis hyacinthi]|uniref:Uncharacterized protein n=1 Tax=Botrytis hyacinthi TaxID=278943 RepID=A0A4Z1GW44_9HELO|nr:hypothetical protein BHYA_0054g00260 [Botrytis hyacinthi]
MLRKRTAISAVFEYNLTHCNRHVAGKVAESKCVGLQTVDMLLRYLALQSEWGLVEMPQMVPSTTLDTAVPNATNWQSEPSNVLQARAAKAVFRVLQRDFDMRLPTTSCHLY